MANHKTLVLDGIGSGDQDLVPVATLLQEELRRTGAQVQTHALRGVKLGSCIGCFGCWLSTPGVCVEPDEGRDIAQAVAQSDTTIVVSPVTFGGYSSQIKMIQDRWLPLVLPYFGVYHGEVHHVPRYQRYPRYVGIGIQRQQDEEEARLFRTLVGRNALNFHAPSHAAQVVTTSDAPDRIREQIRDALARHDAPPLHPAVRSMLSELGPTATPEPDGPRGTGSGGRGQRALLLVGSPKVKSPSTSGVLGGRVLGQLEDHGWETRSLTLRRNLLTDRGQAELLEAVDRSDLILLAFPLYIDSLPFLLMRALELIAAHAAASPWDSPKRLSAISNNGFPEAHHNAVALAICRRFAEQAGMSWTGGLAMGAGTALLNGEPLEAGSHSGLPVHHVAQALDLAGAALADGQPIPAKAAKRLAKTPIPLFPKLLWRWLFQKKANKWWETLAAQNDVLPPAMAARPYSEVASQPAPRGQAS